jgi:hypothetical protein
MLNGRVSLFNRAGHLLGETPAPVTRGDFHANSGSRFLGTRMVHHEPIAELIRISSDGGARVRQRLHVVAFGRDGERSDTLLTLPGTETHVTVRGSSSRYSHVSRDQPFARDASWSSSGGRIVAGSNDRVSYGVHSLDGTLIRIVRVPVLDLPLVATPARLDSLRQAERRGLAESGVPPGTPFEQLMEMFDALELPGVVPRFGRIMTAPDGAVWLSPYGTGDGVAASADWLVFDADGRWLGEVSLPDPQRFRPMEFGEDFVLGLWKDVFDVEYIRTYRIRSRG